MLYDALYEGATTDATSDDLRMCTDDVIGPLNPLTTWLVLNLVAPSGTTIGTSAATARRARQLRGQRVPGLGDAGLER